MTQQTLGQSSDFAGGSYLKPADHMNDLALLIEPISIEKNVPSTYQGTTRVRDEVLADITYFANIESIESGVPTSVENSVKVVHGMLAGTLERNGMGKAFAGIIRKIPTKAGSGFAFRNVEPTHLAKVVTYLSARDAEAEANAASAPGFE